MEIPRTSDLFLFLRFLIAQSELQNLLFAQVKHVTKYDFRSGYGGYRAQRRCKLRNEMADGCQESFFGCELHRPKCLSVGVSDQPETGRLFMDVLDTLDYYSDGG